MCVGEKLRRNVQIWAPSWIIPTCVVASAPSRFSFSIISRAWGKGSDLSRVAADHPHVRGENRLNRYEAMSPDHPHVRGEKSNILC